MELTLCEKIKNEVIVNEKCKEKWNLIGKLKVFIDF